MRRRSAGIEDLAGRGPGDRLVAHCARLFSALERDEPWAGAPATADHERGRRTLLELFEAQAAARWFEVAAARLSAAEPALPLIAPHGEAAAALALATRPTDPVLPRWRSLSFALARAAQLGGDGLSEVAAALCLSAEDPMSGGRYPIPGLANQAILAHTSTRAAQVPRAVGMAWAIGRVGRARTPDEDPMPWPADSVVTASFSSTELNQANLTGTLNALSWAVRWRAPLPLLLVCEEAEGGTDPQGWAMEVLANVPGVEFLHADAWRPRELLLTAETAIDQVRTRRRPMILHLGSGFSQTGSVDPELDPLAATMTALVQSGSQTQEVAQRFDAIRIRVQEACQAALERPRLSRPRQVVAPLAPRRPAAVAGRATTQPSPVARKELFADLLPEDRGRLNLADTLSYALQDAAVVQPDVLVLGPDVTRPERPVTDPLSAALGPSRVIATLPDARATLGLALGAAVSGYVPIVDLGTLSDLHAVSDVLREEAAATQFRSGGRERNPLVVRVSAFASNSGACRDEHGVAFLRDIPGLVVACPAHPSDAAGLVRTCVAAAAIDGTVSVMLEPADLYLQRDMLTTADDAWSSDYMPPHTWGMTYAAIGRAATWGSGGDLTMVTFGPGLRLCLRGADSLARIGIAARVVDLRWLAPLPVEDVLVQAEATGRLLIVDPTRRTGGVSEGLITTLVEAGFAGRLARLAPTDSYPAAGPAAGLLTVSEDDVVTAARHLCSVVV